MNMVSSILRRILEKLALLTKTCQLFWSYLANLRSSWLLHCHALTSISRFPTDQIVKCDELSISQYSSTDQDKVTHNQVIFNMLAFVSQSA